MRTMEQGENNVGRDGGGNSGGQSQGRRRRLQESELNTGVTHSLAHVTV